MSVGKLAATLGIGLVAGFAGTVAITASQAIEMRLRRREPSDTPAKAAEKVLHIHPDDEQAEAVLNNGVHFAYGTTWGTFRSVLDLAGLRGLPASAVHFAAIQGAAFIVLPGLKVAPPVTEWGAKEIAIEMGHHAVYAIAAGLTYDALSRSLLAEAPQAVESESGAPWAAVAAGLAALALRRPKRPDALGSRMRVTFMDRVPAGVRDRLGDR
jgi:MYXO-CTERM domain-containing protein